jgi:hypothetical protein
MLRMEFGFVFFRSSYLSLQLIFIFPFGLDELSGSRDLLRLRNFELRLYNFERSPSSTVLIEDEPSIQTRL